MMIVFNTDAMLRLFSETSKSFRQILKNFSEKPVTALPNASQWLPPRVSRTSGDGADSSMHGVLPPTWDNR